MSYVNQVPNLPYRFDVAMTPLMQYRLDSPPFIPNIPGMPAFLQYLLPVICSTIANELAAKSSAHQGRMFLYNKMSVNNFTNNDFATAVNFVIDIITLNMRKGLYRTPEDAINPSINDTLSILASLVFQEFPALTSVTPPDIVFQASKNIQAYYSLSNEINAMKMQGQAQPMMNQNVGAVPMMINPSFGMNSGMGMQQPQFQNNFGNPNIQGAINNSNMSSSVFTTNKSVSNNVTVVPRIQTDQSKYDYLKPKQSAVPMVTASNSNIDLVPNKTGLKITDWMPSAFQPYPPTINPYRTKLELEDASRNGMINKILNIIPLKDDEMDRSKHIITSMSQVYTSHIPNDYGTREESLEDNVKKIFKIDYEKVNAFKKDPDRLEQDSKELLSFINPDWTYESFVETGIFNSKFQQREYALKDPNCSIYRTYCIVTNPIICNDDHTAYIQELSACKSFKEVSIILKETINDSLTSKSLIDLCYGIEKILTKEINHVLRNKMSLPNTSIESFIDDVNDLPDYLNQNLGDTYRRVFLDFQRLYVEKIVSGPESVDEYKMECCMVAETENPLLKINFINHLYSFTNLTVESSELGIEPYSECASSILEYEHPLMYEIVTSMFSQDRDIERVCLHNLIITADDVIYEVQKGLIGSDIYTINYWKK